jgi:hypothetical protein
VSIDYWGDHGWVPVRYHSPLTPTFLHRHVPLPLRGPAQLRRRRHAGQRAKSSTRRAAAHAQGARLLLAPEGAICGYIAEDLLLRPAFMAACDEAVQTVARETAALKDLVIVVGHPVGGDARGPA